MSLENPFSSPEKKPEVEKNSGQESLEKSGESKKKNYVEGDPSKGINVQRLGDNLSEKNLKKIEKMKEKRENKEE